MKRKCSSLTITLALLLMSGCIPSLYPLYTEADLVTDARLPGTWQADDEDDLLWTFSQSDNAYRLAVFDDGTCAPYAAHLVSFGKFLFLDLTPIKSKSGQGMYDSLLLRLHTFFLVKISDDRLELRALDIDKLKRALEEGTISATLLELDGESVLAETTPRLQELAVQLAETPGQFGEPEVMVRR